MKHPSRPEDLSSSAIDRPAVDRPQGSPPNPPTAVLFAGYRRRALDAARALGLEVVVVAEKLPPKRRRVYCFERSLDVDCTDWNEVAALAAQGRRIGAVLPLTEKSVVPAACLRRSLNLADDSTTKVAERVTDKLLMKEAISAAGIPCAAFTELSTKIDGERLISQLGLPLVLKARVGSGGRSNRLVRRRSELPEEVPPGFMAESFVPGIEMSFESLLMDGKPVFTNPTDYFRVGWASIAPAALPTATLEAVEELNLRALQALGVGEGMTHLELFLTLQGPVFGELAARPPGGHLTDLIELAYGFDPWQAWLRIALGEKLELPQSAHRTAGAWLFHPGAGVLRSVSGLGAARAVPGVERLYLRIEPGAKVSERVGSGQEVGHLLVTGEDRDEVEECLRRAHRLVRFRMAADPP